MKRFLRRLTCLLICHKWTAWERHYEQHGHYGYTVLRRDCLRCLGSEKR